MNVYEAPVYFTLDRIEGDWAVFDCPFGALRLPRKSIGPNTQEGDVFSLEQGRLLFCPEETQKAHARVKALAASLFAD